jgi:hypothetical protein
MTALVAVVARMLLLMRVFWVVVVAEMMAVALVAAWVAGKLVQGLKPVWVVEAEVLEEAVEDWATLEEEVVAAAECAK